MTTSKRKGKFIVLEGVDGSGISTQTALLRDWFAENASLGKAYFTKEPTDGPVGALIRLALSKRLKPLDERVMALLFAADRLDHLYTSEENEQKAGIVSLLASGCSVISDRYYLSSLAYQSVQTDLQWLLEINAYALKPDLTILLMVPVKESAQRRQKSRIHEELYERDDYLQKISENYGRIARDLQSAGENIVIIDGDRDQQEIFAEIKEAVMKLFV